MRCSRSYLWLVGLGRVVCFSGLHRLLLAPAQDEQASPPAFHPLVNFLPESHKIVHGGNYGYRYHEPDGSMGDDADGKEEEAEIPGFPMKRQNRSYDRDNLHHHFELTQVTGFNGEAGRRRNGT